MQNNTKIFEYYNEDAHQFYNENGWVVLKPVLQKTQLNGLRNAWEKLCEDYSANIGCTLDSYLEVISQWRSLWKADRRYNQALTEQLAPLAAQSFGLTGARLLHDHIICKTYESNGEIPWHQDSMYWPMDRTGMSVWTCFYDAPVEHGCLEVAPGSHLWGASRPVDFMATGPTPADDANTILLPVSAGDVVLLSSRTWHRSQPTKVQRHARPAYITLWVPPNTRYRPSNAAWHPLNEQVSVDAGELLNTDEFPIFGETTMDFGSSDDNRHEGVPSPKGMFNAKARIQSDIERLLGRKGEVSTLLAANEERQKLLHTLSRSNPTIDVAELKKLIEAVWISASAYELHRSRNVFNSAYARWEKLSQEPMPQEEAS